MQVLYKKRDYQVLDHDGEVSLTIHGFHKLETRWVDMKKFPLRQVKFLLDNYNKDRVFEQLWGVSK